MSKKGAHSSGGGKGRDRAANQSMAASLRPSPSTWRRNAWDWPYHNNLGTSHARHPKDPVPLRHL
jgi:hypothetical protein